MLAASEGVRSTAVDVGAVQTVACSEVVVAVPAVQGVVAGFAPELIVSVVAEQLIDLTAELSALSAGEAALPETARQVGQGSWTPKSRDFH